MPPSPSPPAEPTYTRPAPQKGDKIIPYSLRVLSAWASHKRDHKRWKKAHDAWVKEQQRIAAKGDDSLWNLYDVLLGESMAINRRARSSRANMGR